jgi:hypothetical protein
MRGIFEDQREGAAAMGAGAALPGIRIELLNRLRRNL